VAGFYLNHPPHHSGPDAVLYNQVMSVLKWFKREWHVIEGHAKWDFYKWAFALAGASVVALGAYLVHRMRNFVPDWLPYVAAFGLALFVFFWVGSKLTGTSNTIQPAEPVVLVAPPDVASEVHALNPDEPDLKTEILEVFFYLKRLSISNDNFILMRLRVVNHGTQEAVVTGWQLRLSVGDAHLACEEEEDIPANWRLHRIDSMNRVRWATEDFNRDASAFNEPLRKGVPKERWVCFKAFTLVRMLPPHNAKMTITLTDAFRRTHQTEHGPGFTSDMGEIVEEGVTSRGSSIPGAD
jgi:hypothetical protein